MRFERKVKRVGTVEEFLNGKQIETRTIDKVVAHIEDYSMIYASVGLTVLFVLGAPDLGLAGGYTNGVIDREARIIYKDLVDIGKWLIIAKGGWEVISSALKSDAEMAKKKCIGYLIAYACLHGLPIAFEKVDLIFQRMGGA